MKSLKKRLPALLAVMLIAVMPLLLCVPASAADSPMLSYNGVILPDYTCIPGYSYLATETRLFICFDEGNYYLFSYTNFPTSDGSGVYAGKNGSSVRRFTLVDNVWQAGDHSSVSGGTLICKGLIWSKSDLYTTADELAFSGSDPQTPPPPPPPDLMSDGLFPVFTAFGSWIVGASLSAFDMFYTPADGLSVLGVLALASLAIAFVILIIYFLAGWLKFK